MKPVRICILLLVILLTMYPIVELTRVIIEVDILRYHCILASPTTYAVELSFMWIAYLFAISGIGYILKKWSM